MTVKSLTRMNELGSCCVMFLMLWREKSLRFGIYIFHMVNFMWGRVTLTAIASKLV